MAAEPLTLLSATPSSYARMNRVALALKGIPFVVQNEIPWESSTCTPHYNPLEKLPVLIFPDDRPPVYESAHIQNYIVEKYADIGPALIPADLDGSLQARQIVALAVGCMDSILLSGWEVRREKEVQSQRWIDRQGRKIDGAMRAFDEYAMKADGGEFMIGREISIADIAIVCTVGVIEFLDLRPGWQGKHPALATYFERLDSLQAFAETRPVMFDMTEQIV